MFGNKIPIGGKDEVSNFRRIYMNLIFLYYLESPSCQYGANFRCLLIKKQSCNQNNLNWFF